jgi:hypothetical protein
MIEDRMALAQVEAVALRRANAAWRAVQRAAGLDQLDAATAEWLEADRALRAARRIELAAERGDFRQCVPSAKPSRLNGED